ncbi:MAG: pyridoxamine 5'-phosphate oxidase family protein [Methanosarcinales archaeon]|nr:pyridoxamine 5'-phosphate oxidase family protein [Methanosarcinales archaeon]
MKMSKEIQDMINENLVHLATTSKDNNPNVVPVGGIRAISDNELLIIDVLFDKTKKNLLENPKVAIAIEVLREGPPRGYQLKGHSTIHTSGKFFEQAKMMVENMRKKRPNHPDLKLQSAVLVEVEEIYSTVLKKEGE